MVLRGNGYVDKGVFIMEWVDRVCVCVWEDGSGERGERECVNGRDRREMRERQRERERERERENAKGIGGQRERVKKTHKREEEKQEEKDVT